MNRPWNPSTPIEDLWTQIQKARNYAAADNTISDTTAILSAIQNLTSTGLFQIEFNQWRNKTPVDQAYANLMTHFNQANSNQLLAKTTSEAGYTATTQAHDKEKTDHSGSIKGYHYCWTHGVNKTHHSGTCKNPKDGHVRTSTIANIQGGSVYLHQPKKFNNRNRQGAQHSAAATGETQPQNNDHNVVANPPE
jgi:hypothetical protein